METPTSTGIGYTLEECLRFNGNEDIICVHTNGGLVALATSSGPGSPVRVSSIHSAARQSRGHQSREKNRNPIDRSDDDEIGKFIEGVSLF